MDGWATITGENEVQVLLYCHHDDWDVKETYDIDLTLVNLPFNGKAIVKHSRIDESHSNAYAEWVRQGKPNYPNPGQYEAIKGRESIELCEAPQTVLIHEGRLEKHLTLPTHAISFLTIEKV